MQKRCAPSVEIGAGAQGRRSSAGSQFATYARRCWTVTIAISALRANGDGPVIRRAS